MRFATLAKNLDDQLLQQVESVMTGPPATDRYAKLKNELIRICHKEMLMRFKKFFKGNRIGTKDEVDEDSSYQKKKNKRRQRKWKWGERELEVDEIRYPEYILLKNVSDEKV